jgi:hypothetical protein
MIFTVTNSYDHSADDVLKVLTDFECVCSKYEALGQSSVELVQRDKSDDGAIVMVTRRVVPLDLPGFAKRVLSPKQTVTQTDTWSAPDAQGSRTGTFAVESKGAPVRVSGTLVLAPKGAQCCTNTTTVTIECKVPLIGGKIADFVGANAHDAVDHEQKWISAYLAQQ